MSDSQWEAAARRFCEIQGVDPDGREQDMSYTGGAWATRPRWRNIADELKRHAAMNEAIEYGRSL